MDLYDAQKLAEELMHEHLGDDRSGDVGAALNERSWVFKWDRAKTRAGCCSFRTRTIQLSMPQTSLHTEDVVRDTILHEIAHALAGPRHHHDAHWRAICRKIGAAPNRCTATHNEAGERVAQVDAPWVGMCDLGHEPRQFHRAPQRVSSCGRCARMAYGRVKFDPAFLVRWMHKGKWAELTDMPVKYQREYNQIMSRLANK